MGCGERDAGFFLGAVMALVVLVTLLFRRVSIEQGPAKNIPLVHKSPLRLVSWSASPVRLLGCLGDSVQVVALVALGMAGSAKWTLYYLQRLLTRLHLGTHMSSLVETLIAQE